MSRKFEALLLDLDGLLIDSEKVYHEVGYAMTAELGKTLTLETIAKQMGRSPYESMEIYRADLGIDHMSTQELVDWRDQRMIAAYQENIDLMPGAAELLAAAFGQYKMAIATGSTRNLVDIVVDQLDLKKYMDHIQASDTVAHGKPNPDIFEACLHQIGVEARTAVVVEDSSNGCLAGKRAGCHVVAVPSEYTRHQDFSMADVIKSDLFEVWDYIK